MDAFAGSMEGQQSNRCRIISFFNTSLRRIGMRRLLALFVLAVAIGRRAPAQTAVPEPKGLTYSRYADGLYARRAFSTPSPKGDYTVEVWRFSVPPHTKSALVVLPGAAALVVRLGAVTVIGGNKEQPLRLGQSLLVPEGERVI